MSFTIFQKVIRRNQYFVCRKRVDDNKSARKIYYEYEFTELANPFEPLIKVFVRLTFPTKILTTQELINFMLEAVKTYRQYKLQDKLLQQFFMPNAQRKSLQQASLVSSMKNMLQNSQAANNKTFRVNSNFPPMMSVLQDDLRSITDGKQTFDYFKNRLDNNLAKYSIIPRSIKLARVKALAQALEGVFETKISVVQNSLILKIKGAKHHVDQIVPLEILMNSSHMIDEVDDQQISDACRQLLEQVISFQKYTQDFYQEKKAEIQRITRGIPQKVHQQNKYKDKDRPQLNQSYLKLTPQNVVFYVEKLQDGEGMKNSQSINQNFIIKKVKMESQKSSIQKNQTKHLYKVTPDFCSIDLSTIFLHELGIILGLPGEKRKTGPTSIIGTIKHYCVLPTLRNFDFSDQIQEQQSLTQLKDIREKQIGPILSWLTIVSTLDRIFLLKQKTSIYHQNFSSKKVIELLMNKDSILGTKVPTLLLLYEMQIQGPLSICQFQFSSWSNFLRQIENQQKDYYQKHKYDIAKLLLYTMDHFYFGPQNFKHKVQKTSFYRYQPNIIRYLILLLTSKFIQLTFERQILMAYQEQADDIKMEHFGFKKIIEKHEAIQQKVQEKIDNDYSIRSNKEDANKKQLEKPIFAQNGLYFRLIKMKFGTLCILDGQFSKESQLKRCKEIDKVREEIIAYIRQKFRQENMNKAEGIAPEQKFVIKKNLLFLEAMFILNSKNYCEVKGIEAQVYKMKQSFQSQGYKAPNQISIFFQQKMQIIRSFGNQPVDI